MPSTSNNNSHDCDNNSSSHKLEWREVTQANPCPACGKTSSCRIATTLEGQVKVYCRRESEGGCEKQYSNGTPYWVHAVNPDSDPQQFDRFSRAVARLLVANVLKREGDARNGKEIRHPEIATDRAGP